jgi:hypothetical protein
MTNKSAAQMTISANENQPYSGPITSQPQFCLAIAAAKGSSEKKAHQPAIPVGKATNTENMNRIVPANTGRLRTHCGSHIT